MPSRDSPFAILLREEAFVIVIAAATHDDLCATALGHLAQALWKENHATSADVDDGATTALDHPLHFSRGHRQVGQPAHARVLDPVIGELEMVLQGDLDLRLAALARRRVVGDHVLMHQRPAELARFDQSANRLNSSALAWHRRPRGGVNAGRLPVDGHNFRGLRGSRW